MKFLFEGVFAHYVHLLGIFDMFLEFIDAVGLAIDDLLPTGEFIIVLLQLILHLIHVLDEDVLLLQEFLDAGFVHIEVLVIGAAFVLCGFSELFLQVLYLLVGIVGLFFQIFDHLLGLLLVPLFILLLQLCQGLRVGFLEFVVVFTKLLILCMKGV